MSNLDKFIQELTARQEGHIHYHEFFFIYKNLLLDKKVTS